MALQATHTHHPYTMVASQACGLVQGCRRVLGRKEGGKGGEAMAVLRRLGRRTGNSEGRENWHPNAPHWPIRQRPSFLRPSRSS